MKEIIYDFPRSRAKNAQHVQFATDVLAAVTEEVATAQGFASQRSAFATATTAEQDCFKVSRKYVDTTEVASRDSVRDNVALFYRGIARVNAEYGLTAETRKAGQLVFDLFNNAGDVVRMDYASETATLTDLVGKMRETMYAEALTAIRDAESTRARARVASFILLSIVSTRDACRWNMNRLACL